MESKRGLEFYKTSVTSETTGATEDADLMRCCDQNRFMAFRIAGQEHWHLQCVTCGTSYCPAGACEVLEGLKTWG